jgi:6-pyruvoyltetrahydropterin/6-carboxytetrahydropterin synthase
MPSDLIRGWTAVVEREAAQIAQRRIAGAEVVHRDAHEAAQVATRTLDERNWCFDFGGLKPIRAWLHEMFDHTLIVAADDPEIAQLRELGHRGLASVRVLPAVGCEAVAKFVHDHVSAYVHKENGGRVWLESVEVREHGGNSAIYES